MPKAALNPRASSTSESGSAAPAPKKHKVSSFLVTSDTDLWGQVGTHLTHRLVHRQIDSIDELLAAIPADQPGVILWDARGAADRLGEISRLQAHSSRFALVALDDAAGAADWAQAMQLGQVVGFVQIPIETAHVTDALATAYEEVNARVALLGEGAGLPPSSSPARAAPLPKRRRFWIGAGVAGALMACVLVVLYLRDGNDSLIPAPHQQRGIACAGVSDRGPGDRGESRFSHRRGAARDATIGTSSSLRRAVRCPCIAVRWCSIPRAARPARVCSAWRKYSSRACNPLWMSGSSTPRCRRSRRCAASIRATRGSRRSMSASRKCAPSSVRPKSWRRSTRRISIAPRSSSRMASARNPSVEPKLAQLREELRRHRAQQDVAHLVSSDRCAPSTGSIGRAAQRQRRVLSRSGAPGGSDSRRASVPNPGTGQADNHGRAHGRRAAKSERCRPAHRRASRGRRSAVGDGRAAARYRRGARPSGPRTVRPVEVRRSRARSPRAGQRHRAGKRQRPLLRESIARGGSAERRAAPALQSRPVADSDPGPRGARWLASRRRPTRCCSSPPGSGASRRIGRARRPAAFHAIRRCDRAREKSRRPRSRGPKSSTSIIPRTHFSERSRARSKSATRSRRKARSPTSRYSMPIHRAYSKRPRPTRCPACATSRYSMAANPSPWPQKCS